LSASKRRAIGHETANEAEVTSNDPGEGSKKGGVWEALSRSPLVGADIDFTRDVTDGRKVDL
jgi:hypothetical protein